MAFVFCLGRHAFAAGALILLCACGTLPRNAAPAGELTTAEISGFPPEIRAVGLIQSPELQSDFAVAMADGGFEQGCDTNQGNPIYCVLVISGGGGNGAYGAGLLNGWSGAGTRPEFKIVTGVSTGGLIAPFAFLGPDWDDELADAYTTIEGQSDLIRERSILGILWNDSVATVEPLVSKIEAFVSPELVDAIAHEHRSGRRLYLGTTNLDTQTFTVWNMGAIAATGGNQALELFRKVMLASASIPILMPPVVIDVEVDGVTYDELHADGGVLAQFFVPLRVINLPEAIQEAQQRGFDYTPRPRMFVIRNDRINPKPRTVERSLADISIRAIDSMIQSMGRADLYQIYAIARVRGDDFRYTEVPEEFALEVDDMFNGQEMRRLFELGVEAGGLESTWQRTPPGVFARNIE